MSLSPIACHCAFSAGRKVAIDASMCLYQFLIAVTRADGAHLTDADGDTTRSPDGHMICFILNEYALGLIASIALGNIVIIVLERQISLASCQQNCHKN